MAKSSRQPDPGRETRHRVYWRWNLAIIGILLAFWGIASFLCSIVFVESLNRFSIGKLPLGYWIANQGSMYLFVVLILIYAVAMDWIDRRLSQPFKGDQS